MITAIIVVSIILAVGLVALFITVGILWHKSYPKLLPNGQPRPKQTVKEWFISHKPSKRRLIQVYAALLTNANIKGFVTGDIYRSETTKYACVPGLNCYSCPGAVGACPLGALQNALYESKTSAPYYVLGILALFGLTLARTICGFLCPVGLAQDLLYKIRTPKVKKSRATRVLSYLKYVFLAVLVIAIPLAYAAWNMPMPGFCKYICPAGTFGGAIMLLLHPGNADKFASLGPLFTWKFCVMVAIIAAAIFIYRFFCRFFCPLGAIYGFFNRIALLGVKVDKENCTNCGLCVSHCKMDVKRVGDHECINCGECISVCPTQAIRWKGSKIFVHANAVEAPPTDEKPLGQFQSTAASIDTPAAAQLPSTGFTGSIVVAEHLEEVQEPTVAVKKPKKTAKFWTELTAWILAILLLVGALVYYNFIDVAKGDNTGYKIGDTAPDFTVRLINSDEEFNLYEHRGSYTVINFWSTQNEQSKEQLPYFNELISDYPDVNMLTVHGVGKDSETAEEYIAQNCDGWALPFAQDEIQDGTAVTYAAFGGEEVLPLTVIVNADGVIVYNNTYAFEDYEDLKTTVQTVMAYGKIGHEVGNTAPDFTIQRLGADGTFNLYEHRGKITIINFWATWCTPCKAELPYFNELSGKHTEWNVIAIHGTLAGGSPEEYIAQNCSDWALPFAQDNLNGLNCLTYTALGGDGSWPLTVIVNEDGRIIYNSAKSFHTYDELEAAVLNAIEKSNIEKGNEPNA